LHEPCWAALQCSGSDGTSCVNPTPAHASLIHFYQPSILSVHTTENLESPFAARLILQSVTGHPLRQVAADYYSDAKAAGLLHLLPPGPKTHSNAAKEPTPAEDGTLIDWLRPWHREKRPGSETGAPRLYVGRKRLFKGHKWERTRLQRRTRTFARLRDMDRRVHRWRMVWYLHYNTVRRRLNFLLLDTHQQPSQSSPSSTSLQEHQAAVLTVSGGDSYHKTCNHYLLL
jgi:large subunit ribosomal protein L25